MRAPEGNIMRQQQSADAPLSEQTTAPTEPVELSNQDLRHVTGGLNPQPLPPGHETYAF